MSKEIVWCDIPVKDLNRAMAFYASVLDREVVKRNEGDTAFAAILDVDKNPSASIVPCTDNHPSITGPLIYLNCDQRLEAAASAVTAHGGTVLQPPHSIGPWGFRAVVLDCEGNRVALYSK